MVGCNSKSKASNPREGSQKSARKCSVIKDRVHLEFQSIRKYQKIQGIEIFTLIVQYAYSKNTCQMCPKLCALHCSLLENTPFSSEMTLIYWMIVQRYPNQTEWLAVRFFTVKSSLYLTEN